MADADKVKTAVNPSPDLGETTVYDRDGDLTLVVGAGERRALVCSRALSRASPVFRQMLNCPFSESRQNVENGKPWIVKLPDDNWQATHVLLSIIHRQFSQVSELEARKVHDVLIFTDKYGMTKLIIPWAKSWIPCYSMEEITDDGTEYLFWITVAWELGHDGLFAAGLQGAISNCSIRSDGRLLFFHDDSPYGIPFEELNLPLFPPGLLDEIAAAREKISAMFLDWIQRDILELRQFEDYTNTETYTAGPDSRWEVCCATVLGVLVSCLTELFNENGQPELLSHVLCNLETERNDIYKGTLIGVLDALRRIRIHSIDYKICNNRDLFANVFSIDETIRDYANKITGRMRARMSERAKTLGINWA